MESFLERLSKYKTKHSWPSTSNWPWNSLSILHSCVSLELRNYENHTAVCIKKFLLNGSWDRVILNFKQNRGLECEGPYTEAEVYRIGMRRRQGRATIHIPKNFQPSFFMHIHIHSDTVKWNLFLIKPKYGRVIAVLEQNWFAIGRSHSLFKKVTFTNWVDCVSALREWWSYFQ